MFLVNISIAIGQEVQTDFQDTTKSALLSDTVQSDVLMDTIPTTDGFYQANNLKDAVPFAYPKVDPKNVRFYKRIWRDIDLNEEQNYVFAIPGASLIEAIMAAIKEGRLTPYSPEDDSFKTKLTAKDGEARFADSVLVPIFDGEGNQVDAKMVLNDFNPARVTKFRIKEDLFFDKQRSKLETRIIGVAPLMQVNTSSDLAESVGETPAFWLYFPQLRYVLAQLDVSDPDKGIYDMTMDDLFVQRRFSSKIIRESSPGSQYLATQDSAQAINGEAIEDKIELYKANLWKNPKGIKNEDLVFPNNGSSKKAREEKTEDKEESVPENKPEPAEKNTIEQENP